MSDVYAIITDRVIGLLEKGVVPWHKPWHGGERMPRNLVSGKAYRGVNVFLLHAMAYESPYWLTYKQAQELGGNVRKGEHACPVVFWKWLDRGGKRGRSSYTPCSISPKAPRHRRSGKVQQSIRQRADRCRDAQPDPAESVRAFYSPGSDAAFVSETFEAGSLLQRPVSQLTHSTGHQSRRTARVWRVKRRVVGFGSNLQQEELVAERVRHSVWEAGNHKAALQSC